MHRFFVNKEQIPVITGSDAHQIKDVLRMKTGDKIDLLDGTGAVYACRIKTIQKNKVDCEILEKRAPGEELPIKLALAQCLPKGKKMDLIIQKCTELGISRIIPTLSERSIAKAGKPERWKKIAKEAAEQCGRTSIPEISPLTKFEDVLKLKTPCALALIPWELEKEITLKQMLKDRKSSDIFVLIGPEGGFSRKEIELAVDAGFTPVTLGKAILRTETAGMAILAAIRYELG